MNKPSSSFVTTVDLSIQKKLKADLIEKGFEISTPPYTVFSAKSKGLSCTLYQSGKLMVQGKEMAQFIEFYLEPEILKAFNFGYEDLEIDKTPRIGIDESGKGDFFGPLCVAGVFAEGEGILKLKELGVKDSKLLNDATILKVAKKIRENFIHHIVKINPKKYNELYAQFKNLNRLLAWGHATAIEQLVEKANCKFVIIDQFANEEVVITALKRKKLEIELTQRHRGEEDLVVAAASILARETFLEGMDSLSKTYGLTLPKGASALTIKIGKTLVVKYGKEVLESVGKLHFKTLEQIL
jgi:ribonuclease HIII